jgi:hypothetical protein
MIYTLFLDKYFVNYKIEKHWFQGQLIFCCTLTNIWQRTSQTIDQLSAVQSDLRERLVSLLLAAQKKGSSCIIHVFDSFKYFSKFKKLKF